MSVGVECKNWVLCQLILNCSIAHFQNIQLQSVFIWIRYCCVQVQNGNVNGFQEELASKASLSDSVIRTMELVRDYPTMCAVTCY